MTHLCVYNNGSINASYGKENIPQVKEIVFKRAEEVAREFELPLLKLESNFQYVVPQSHLRTHTYMDALAIYALQKLWRVYYYSSAYPVASFSLENNLHKDPAYFEPFLLDCFSTSKLRIISSGSEGDRNDKIDFIAGNPVVQKYLHVCTTSGDNCGKCPKCLRTLLSLDAANILGKFREVFDIDRYIKIRNQAYKYLNNRIKENPEDPFWAKSYKVLYERHKKFFDSLNAKKK